MSPRSVSYNDRVPSRERYGRERVDRGTGNRFAVVEETSGGLIEPEGPHQLRAEAFNVLNTVTPGNPQTTSGTTDFGRVTSLAAGTAPRVIQLGAKYQF